MQLHLVLRSKCRTNTRLPSVPLWPPHQPRDNSRSACAGAALVTPLVFRGTLVAATHLANAAFLTILPPPCHHVPQVHHPAPAARLLLATRHPARAFPQAAPHGRRRQRIPGEGGQLAVAAAPGEGELWGTIGIRPQECSCGWRYNCCVKRCRKTQVVPCAVAPAAQRSCRLPLAPDRLTHMTYMTHGSIRKGWGGAPTATR